MSPDDTAVLPSDTPGPLRRRLIILATAGLALVLLAGAVFTACSVAPTLGEEPELGVEEVLPPGLPEPEPVILELGPAPEPPPDEPEPVPLDGAEQTGSADGQSPCPGLLADGLVATPNPVRINSGSRGYTDIKNCGPQPVSWTASTVPWVNLDETGGDLPSGAVFRLLFTVNTLALPDGSYSFTISVNNINVTVNGMKLGLAAPGVTPSPVPSIGGLIAPGVSPCATRCISQATLSTRPGRADLSLDVRTNTPADIVVMVDTREPSYSNDDEPYYTDPQLRFATDSRRSQWTVLLTPLAPDTRYHIVVAARDHLGGASFETGTFRTPKVVDQLAGNEPGGCATSCVSQAVLLPHPGGLTYDIEVRTHVPARLQVNASGPGTAASVNTGDEFVTQWSAELVLEPGTRYEVVLRATDEQGHTAQHTALVDTPVAESHHNQVLVTFHHIQVHNDADDTLGNRKGELRFLFKVGGEPFGILNTGERKVRAPARFDLDDGDKFPGRSVIIDNAPDNLLIQVQGIERDRPNLFHKCFGTPPFFEETSGRTVIDCDEYEWNTAVATIDLHQDQAGGALPSCFGFGDGVTADICAQLPATGDDPTFTVFVTIDFLD